MNNITLAALLALLTMSSEAFADEIVVSGLYTKHIKTNSDTYNYNEGFLHNYGIGMNKTILPEHSFGVGGIVYKDSYYKTAYSAYAYKEFAYKSDSIEAGVMLKVGYLNGSGYNSVVAIPSLYVRKDGYKLETIVIPKTDKSTGFVTVLVGKSF